MVVPVRESGIDEWIQLVKKLSSLESFALIGLLSLRPSLQASIIQTGSLKSEENLAVAEKWAASNFRKVFGFYCKNHKIEAGKFITGWTLKKGDIIKSLAEGFRLSFYPFRVMKLAWLKFRAVWI